MTEPATPPPGWYTTTDGEGYQWWDGAQWTEHRTSAQQTMTAAPQTMKSTADGTAVLGYILAVLLPFIGFLVGLAMVARGHRHAVGVILVSVLAFVLWLALLADSAGL